MPEMEIQQDSPVLIAKQKELEAKNTERSELLAKDNLASEDVQKLNTLNEECQALTKDLQTLQAAINGVKQHQVENPDADKAFKHLGTTPSGKTVLDMQSKGGERTAVLEDQTGFGLLSEKQSKVLREDSYLNAFEAYARKGLGRMDGIDRKNLEEGLDPQGGYFIPPDYVDRLIQRTISPTRVHGRVTMLNTGRDRITMPKINYNDGTGLDIYSTGFRVTWTGENPSSSTVHRVTDTDLFGRVEIDVYTAMMSSVITKDMAEDSSFPILSWVADKMGETVMILYDNMILNGDGITQPYGILTNPGGSKQPEVVLSGVANSLDADAIRGFPFKLPEQYINESTCWVMNRADCGRTISLLKDGENRYLWARGSMDDKLANAVLDSLDGYPVVYSAFMPNIGDGAYPIIFGDLRGFYLVNRIGLSVTFYHDSNYDQLNQIGVGGRVRFGGRVVEEYRMKIMKSDNA